MGLFGGGGKKKTCSFCGGKAGLLNSWTLTDGEKICNQCAKGISTFVAVNELGSADVTYQKDVHERMAAFVAEADSSGAISHPRWLFHRSYPLGKMTIYPELGMFSMQKLETGETPVELLRFDQLAKYSPRTENPMFYKSDTYALKRVGFLVRLQGHPYLAEAEVEFAKNVEKSNVDELVKDVADLASGFDRLLGIPEVAGLAGSVAGAFGLQADLPREVNSALAANLAELTQRADAAIQQFGQVW